MLTKTDYSNLATLLSVAKFDNVTLQFSALHVSLFDKLQKLAQEPETNGDSNGTSPNQSGPDESPKQQ